MEVNMFQNLYPSEDCDSAYQIDYEGFYDKGYRGILFDVDNTLVEHDQPVTLPAIELFENLKEIGFKTCIISNNKDYRVKPLADALESEYVYKAGKPSKAGYEKGTKRKSDLRQRYPRPLPMATDSPRHCPGPRNPGTRREMWWRPSAT